MTDILVKDLDGTKASVRMTLLEFCTKHPKRAARMLEVLLKENTVYHCEKRDDSKTL